MHERLRAHTDTTHTPQGPVFAASLSAFSLHSHHLHTNTFCGGPGTNTKTLHISLPGLNNGGMRGSSRACKESEGGRWTERQSGGRQGLLFPPSLKTHLGPVHAQLKTSFRHPLPLLLLHPLLLYLIRQPPPPGRQGRELFWEVSGVESLCWFPARATRSAQVSGAPAL